VISHADIAVCNEIARGNSSEREMHDFKT